MSLLNKFYGCNVLVPPLCVTIERMSLIRGVTIGRYNSVLTSLPSRSQPKAQSPNNSGLRSPQLRIRHPTMTIDRPLFVSVCCCYIGY